MRPIKLTMQGFTSFAERAEIDFNDLDLFAITGPTGSGKTSVLDAMAWALYGHTPRLGKCGAELISHGASSLAVNLEFAAGMNRYRVARTAKRTGSPQVRLERWHDGAWVPEEASGVRETSAAICKLIGLDFDAFKLSVILPQGEFDKFLRGDHADRRKILKSLLGLEVYDRMREIAHDRCKDISAKEAAEQDVVTRDYTNATDDYLKALTVGLRQQKHARKKVRAMLDYAEKLCDLANRIDTGRTARKSKQAERAEAEAKYLNACGDAKHKTAEAQKLQQQMVIIEQDHDSIAIDENRAGELVALKTRSDLLAGVIVRHNDSQQILRGIEAELASHRVEQEKAYAVATKADEDFRTAEEARDQWQKRLDSLLAGGSADLLQRLAEDLHGVPEKQKNVDFTARDKENLERRETELRAEIAKLEQRLEAAAAALLNAKQEADELARHAFHSDLRTGLKKGEPCPVCEQLVSVLPKVTAPSERKKAQERVKVCDADLQKLREAAVRADMELRSIPERLKTLHTRVAEVTADISAIRKRVHAVVGVFDDKTCSETMAVSISAIRAAENQVTLSRKQASTAAEVVRKTTRDAAALDRKIAELATRAQGLDVDLGRLSAEISATQPDIDRAGGCNRIITELKAIESDRTRKAELAEQIREIRRAIDEAEQKQKAAEQQVAILGERVRALTADIEALDKSLSDVEAQWTEETQKYELPDGKSEIQRSALWREQLRETHDALQQRIAQLETEVASTKEKVERLTELKARIDAHRRERELYEQIHAALRADRFIDHLLTRAYTDLCTRGSEHLLRLSSDRYSFTGGKNTFCVRDAWNGDAERPAATLSGGESFLASLALALALAESVASFSADRSQATRLDALFLDEGVSTLDQDEALPAVIDALMNLQAGDRMIGVISHMENLANRLPARIEIVKNHGRSASALPAIVRMT